MSDRERWEKEKCNETEKTIQVGTKSFPAPNNWNQFEDKYELLEGAKIVCGNESSD